MPLLPIPVDRELVPPPGLTAPEGFASVDTPILNGMPHIVELAGDLRVVLIVPSGVAEPWREIDPQTLVSSSLPERNPPDAAAASGPGSVARAPARLLLQSASQTIAVAPLVAGVRWLLPRSGDAGARIELIVLEWDLRAGSLRGPGSFGSRLVFAWRRADTAVDRFSEPPLNPVLVKRLPPERRMESRLGMPRLVANARFEHKKIFVSNI